MRGFNNLLGIVSLAFFIGGCSSEEGGEEPHIGGALKVMIALLKQCIEVCGNELRPL